MKLLLRTLIILFPFISLHAQEKNDTMDVTRLIQRITGKEKSGKTTVSGLALLPAIGYNPSVGFILGVNIVNGKYRGDPENTSMSSAAVTGYVTTEGVLNFQLRHNTYFSENKWNFQGNGQITRMVVQDYGLGNGTGKFSREGDPWIPFPVSSSDSAYPIRYNNVRLYEKVYRRVGKSILAGAGINADFHYNIHDSKLNVDSGQFTPHYKYSTAYGFDPKNYITNGLVFNVQYNTRDHTNRSYKGTLFDLTVRRNTKWLGSTQASTQIMTEFREYISLSKTRPETVLAFWHLGSFQVGGNIPYLVLPGTATDTYNRSGRGYTIGRFRGPSFFYLESEFRFPITQNKLISGVVFANVETVSNSANQGLFSAFDPAAGAGLRILFNKATRTNLCIDYAVGKYGANGFFFGLNEVF